MSMSTDSTPPKAMLWKITFRKLVECDLAEAEIIVNTRNVKSAVELAVVKINQRKDHEKLSLYDIYEIIRLVEEE